MQDARISRDAAGDSMLEGAVLLSQEAPVQEAPVQEAPVQEAPVAAASSGRPDAEVEAEPEAGLEALWLELRERLRALVPRQQYETWFRRAALVQADQKVARIAVQNAFTRDWLSNYYRPVLEQAVREVMGGSREVQFEVDPELTAPLQESELDSRQSAAPMAEPAPSAHAPSQPQRAGLMRASDVVLNPNYRFSDFVVGPCNRFAHAAALGVSEAPGAAYNPLFLHGSVGLGKTHLLQSLCHALLEREPDTSILYLSCETFVNHFISALENGDLQKFRTKYRNVDVLVVDDIHILANKERTQEEFFHTFNTLYNAGKQIVLSSDSPPKDIPTLQGRLVSRFKWGLVTEIEPPCFETRMAILKRKSRGRGQELSDEVARMIAERIDTNIRELEGAVTKVICYAGLSGQPVDPDLVRQCLRDAFVERRSQVSTEDILRVVTEHYGVRTSDLQSRKRTAAIAFPRQIGMYLARKITRLSLEEIGGFFGGRDHSTVLYAVQKIERLTHEDPSTADVLVELRARLRQDAP